jgi:hypothetical protein
MADVDEAESKARYTDASSRAAERGDDRKTR